MDLTNWTRVFVIFFMRPRCKTFLADIWCIKQMHRGDWAANNIGWSFLCSVHPCCFCCLSQSIHTITTRVPFGVRINLVDSVLSETCL